MRNILSIFCYPPEKTQKVFKRDLPNDQEIMRQFTDEFHEFKNILSKKKIVDFGSGFGHQAIAFHKVFKSTVLGLEIEKHKIDHSIKKRDEEGIDNKDVYFRSSPIGSDYQSYDLVISLNSFEHFSDPELIIKEMIKLLNKEGQILISFGPPWFSPHGSHMNYFCRLPWVQLFFSENTIMKVRQQYRDDGALYFKDVPGGLNQMSISKFERILKKSGLKISFKKYVGVKKLQFLTKIPLIRELFINQVTIIANK